MPTDLNSTMLFVARLLIGGGFLHAAVFNVPAFDRLTAFLASRGVPEARLALTVATAVQALASLLVILGLWVGLASIALIAFTIAVTLVFHNFWDFTGDERFTKRISFRINLIALGGLFALAAACGF